MSLTREEMIEQSIQDLLTTELPGRGYGPDKVTVLDEFPASRLDSELDTNYIGAGFTFDDGGASGEMGSSLTRRVDTFEFFVFAKNNEFGKNIANLLRDIIKASGQGSYVVIYDYNAAGDPPPELDRLPLLEPGAVRVERIPVRDAKPWEENLWRVMVKVEDYYFAVDQ